MNLEELRLPDSGLVVFGSRPGMGLTTTSLLLANHLARNLRVRFITYRSYKQQLENLLSKRSSRLLATLEINTSLPYYDSNFKYHLASLIKGQEINAIFLDDLDSMIGEAKLGQDERKALIADVSELASNGNTLIVLNTYISNKVDSRFGDHRPGLRDFNWSRNLIDLSDQIYAIYRPEYYCITQDEDGLSTRDRIEVNLLKESARVKR